MRLSERMGGKLPLIGTAAGVITLLIVVFWLQSDDDNSARSASGPPAKAFYTTDDGASFFASPRQIPPFDHDGKQAVQAFVFESGGKKIVGYMMRATPEALQRAAKGDQKTAAATLAMQPGNWEVKRPGDPAWLSMADSRAVQLMTLPSSASGTDVPRLVEPE